MHCTISSSGCSGMQSICARLLEGSIWLLYICNVLDIAVGLAVCKASMLNWLGGVHLTSIYMHCTRSSSGCSSMQGIYARLTVYWYSRHLCSIDWGSRSTSGCISMQGIYAQLTGGVHLPSIYMHCTRSSSGCSSMQGIYAQLPGGPSAFYIYAMY